MGESPQNVSKALNAQFSASSRLLDRFWETEGVEDRPHDRRSHVLSDRQERQLSNEHNTHGNRPISWQTVGQALAKRGLHCRRTYRGLVVTEEHRNALMEWALARQNWRRRQWDCVCYYLSIDRTIDASGRVTPIWYQIWQRERPWARPQRRAIRRAMVWNLWKTYCWTWFLSKSSRGSWWRYNNWHLHNWTSFLASYSTIFRWTETSSSCKINARANVWL